MSSRVDRLRQLEMVWIRFFCTFGRKCKNRWLSKTPMRMLFQLHVCVWRDWHVYNPYFDPLLSPHANPKIKIFNLLCDVRVRVAMINNNKCSRWLTFDDCAQSTNNFFPYPSIINNQVVLRFSAPCVTLALVHFNSVKMKGRFRKYCNFFDSMLIAFPRIKA